MQKSISLFIIRYSLLFIFCFQLNTVTFSLNSIPIKSGYTVRSIIVDFQKEKGKMNTMWKQCIGAGRANEGLRADWQQQLTYVKKRCGFKYIRMHGLLHDDMGVYSEDKNGNPQYNWQYIDKLYDFLLSINMKPFVELSFMPSALASGKQIVFWWKGNVTPPKDFKKWEDLIHNLVMHFTERYGMKEVSTWYFEVWNEPNLSFFFTGTMDDYFRLYDVTANAVKSVSTTYKVGGPATAESNWVKEMIEHCNKNGIPIDFISTHVYGVKAGKTDKEGKEGTVLIADSTSIYSQIKVSREIINKSAIPGLELHYTEWSSSYTPKDPIHDTYHSAAYILDKIKNTGNAANSMSYWVFTDIFEEDVPRFSPFHGGFGLLNYQAINKPAFYAFKFLNKLGETELYNEDKSSWVCKNSDGSVQALFWNFTNTHPGDSVNDQVYYKQDLLAKNAGKIKLEIKNMPVGKYALEIYKIGYRSNDAYATYMDLGSPTQLTKEQVTYIKEVNNGSPFMKKITNLKDKEVFEEELDLRENDVFLVTLQKF